MGERTGPNQPRPNQPRPNQAAAKRKVAKPTVGEYTAAESRTAKSSPRTREPDPAEQARAEIRLARKRRRAQLRAERRRFTAPRRRRRRLVLGVVGIVVLLFVGVFGVAYSPLMALRTITVSGTTTLNQDDIRAALSSQLGTPLPLIDQQLIAKQLGAFPAVQSFSTEAHPPSTLNVRIVERTPIGAISRNGAYDVVDPAGVVLLTAAQAPAGLPVLMVSDTSGDAFKVVGSMLLALPSELRGQLSQAGADSSVDAWFQLSSGPKVIWGDASNPQLKLKVFEALLKASGASVDQINVSAPDSPFTR